MCGSKIGLKTNAPLTEEALADLLALELANCIESGSAEFGLSSTSFNDMCNNRPVIAPQG
jgi:hypothetical protein